MHPEKNAFYGLHFGANEQGIHFAAGPDRMHLMFEGLGKAMLGWVTLILLNAGFVYYFVTFLATKFHTNNPKKQFTGQLDASNKYIESLPTRSNDYRVQLKRVNNGLEGLSVVSAKDLPGVLVQVLLYKILIKMYN